MKSLIERLESCVHLFKHIPGPLADFAVWALLIVEGSIVNSKNHKKILNSDENSKRKVPIQMAKSKINHIKRMDL